MDKYVVAAAAVIAICLIPFLYLAFFILRAFYWAWKMRRTRKSRIVKTDPVFGEIELCQDFPEVKPDWRSIPNGEVSIDAGKDGPTEEQRLRYISIKKDMAQHLDAAKRYIVENDSSADLSKYELTCLTIEAAETDGDFSLRFLSDSSEMEYEVLFKNGKPELLLCGD